MKRIPVILKVLLAWLPFFALWVLFVLVYTGGEAGTGEALESGAVTIGTAAALGFFVWRFTGRFPWPDGISLRFYGLHLMVGLMFAVSWLAVGDGIGLLRSGRDLAAYWAEARRVLGWQLLMGLWIYGGVAAVSYTIRIRARLREQERIAARAQALAAEAQLRALKAQLNPHFLFNALHSVSFLVQEDPDEAESALDQLGELLRYALDEGGGDEVLLMEEWAFTSAYLDLESLRFGSRLRVEVDIDPDAMAYPLPPFSLQPLVENAVRYGVDPRADGGLIAIQAEVDDERLHIRVRDDGPGADPDEVTRRERHGLGDLRRRLSALYGPDAAVLVSTCPGDGFQVSVTLPAEPRDPVDLSGAPDHSGVGAARRGSRS